MRNRLVLTSMLFLTVVVLSNTTAGELKNLPVTETPRFVVKDRQWSGIPGDAYVCIWKDDKLAAVSFTIDDNTVPDHDWWLSMADKYDFHATWFIIADAAEKSGYFGPWSAFQKLRDAGHDLGSHTMTHLKENVNLTLTQEYADAITTINTKVKNANCLTLAYPGGKLRLENDDNLAMQYYIAARGTVGVLNQVNLINYARVNSIGGLLEIENEKHWAYLPNMLNPQHRYFRGWACSHYHNLKSDKDKDKVENLLRYLKENDDNYWIGTFTEVAQYGQLRDTAELTVITNTLEKITLTLTSQMDETLFNYPLTVKICLPTAWQSATAKKDDTELSLRLVEQQGHKYALVAIVPSAGEVSIYPHALDH